MAISPIMMTPAYRFGEATPWGGDGLHTLFHKKIPDERTGESLEASAMPGLESRDPEGQTLTQLIARHGEKLTGKGFAAPFPLLLKLLDARDTLSVQVHPDNEYASRVEHKLGKTEAWYILHAEPGAQLVYGVKKGTTKEALKKACQEGEQVEKLLRRVRVKAGETYYIPAGTVHSVGKGIVLYEIQQSSDVTYRFYDWNRTDKDGNRRELNLQKAVDVARVDEQLRAAKESEIAPGHFKLLREPYFSLDRFENGEFILHPDDRRFALLTAVKDCTLSWADGVLVIPAGRTVLLPADGYELHLRAGKALMAYPTVHE